MAQVSLSSAQYHDNILFSWKHILVSLGGVLEGRENVRVGSTFNSVDEIGNFREEGVIVLSCQPDSDDGKRVRMSNIAYQEGKKDGKEKR